MTSKTAPQQSFAQRLIELSPKLTGIVLLLGVLVIPLVILPLGENLFIDSKNLLFMFLGLIVFAIWALTAFLRKTVQVTLSVFVIPAALLLGSTLLSSFLTVVYPMNQLLGLGGVYLAFSSLILLAPSLIPERFGRTFLFVVTLPALILALTSAAELFKVGPSNLLNQLLPLGLPNSPLFSLSGSPLVAAQVLAIVLAGCLTLLVTAKKALKPFFLLATIVLIGGLIVNGRTLLEQKILTDVLPPFAASWSVGADNLKSVKASLIGVGPESYQQIYLRYKPAWVNTTPVWNLQFNQARNLPLTVLVTHGFLGLIAWAMLVLAVFNRARNSTRENYPFAVMTIITLLIELFFPPNVVLLALQAFIIIFWIVAEKNKLQDVQVHAFTVQLIKSGADVQKVPKHSNFLVYFIAAISAVCVMGCGFWLSKYAYAQSFMFQAVVGTVQNNAVQVYEAQQKAVQINPYSAAYIRAFANTNLAIAQSMAQQADLSEQDKQQILNLIQQAIDQARSTVVIEPQNSLNWLLIARTYNNLVGVADGAESMADSSYKQALLYASTDPIANLELGGLYFRTGNYVQAVQQFEKTVQLKPDWANAFYNLANAYRQNKQFQQAYDAYQQTLLLLPSGDDYSKVKTEQDQVKKDLDAANAQQAQQQAQTQQQNLTTAPPTPTPLPPTQTVEQAPSPSPTPSPTVEPTPTPSPSPTEEANPTEQPIP